MLKSDVDHSGTLDFEEFKYAVKYAQRMMKRKEREKNGNYQS